MRKIKAKLANIQTRYYGKIRAQWGERAEKLNTLYECVSVCVFNTRVAHAFSFCNMRSNSNNNSNNIRRSKRERRRE